MYIDIFNFVLHISLYRTIDHCIARGKWNMMAMMLISASHWSLKRDEGLMLNSPWILFLTDVLIKRLFSLCEKLQSQISPCTLVFICTATSGLRIGRESLDSVTDWPLAARSRELVFDDMTAPLSWFMLLFSTSETDRRSSSSTFLEGVSVPSSLSWSATDFNWKF